MKIKNSSIKKVIFASMILMLSTGCSSTTITKTEMESTSEEIKDDSLSENLVNNNLYYIDAENGEKIPFLEKENIEIIDVLVEDNNNSFFFHSSSDASKFKNIKIKFKNNSSVTLDNVEFKYKLNNIEDCSTTLYKQVLPDKTGEANTSGKIGFYVSDNVDYISDFLENIEDYLTDISYVISKDNMEVYITYKYNENIYEITIKEITDKVYLKKYTYYSDENKIVLISEFNYETSKTNDELHTLSEDSFIENDYFNETISTSSNKKLNISNVEYGKLLDVYQDDGVVVIKTKIEPSYSKKATIRQNGFNIEHIIEENNMDGIEEIQYWAVADMTNGYEEKVVSFTVNKSLINRVKNGSVAGAYIIEEASDVWIHHSLK